VVAAEAFARHTRRWQAVEQRRHRLAGADPGLPPLPVGGWLTPRSPGHEPVGSNLAQACLIWRSTRAAA
jgi:hypothetical protein